MSVRIGRLEGLAKEASDVRFRAFKGDMRALKHRFAAHFGCRYLRVCQCAFCSSCDRLYYGNGNCLVTSDIIQPGVHKPGIDLKEDA